MNNENKRVITGPKKIFFGIDRNEPDIMRRKIYMTKPSFDCGWYWSFGYLGNNWVHYHLDSYQQKDRCIKDKNGQYKIFTEKRNINMHDCLQLDYELNSIIQNNLWSFCEQTKTIYTLKEAYEVFNRGGSHYTSHPLQEKIKNQEIANYHLDLLWELLQNFWDQFSKKAN